MAAIDFLIFLNVGPSKLHVDLNAIHVLHFSLYPKEMRLPWQNVSLIIYIIANYSMFLQLYERYLIILSKTLNFILISGMGCLSQYRVLTKVTPCKMLHIQIIHYHFIKQNKF